MDAFIIQYKALINGVKLTSLFALILLDTLLGIVLAVKNKTFKWGNLTDFLDTSVMMMAGGYFLVGVFAVFEPAYQASVPLVWLALDAKLAADIINKLKDLGVPISLPSFGKNK